MIGPAGPPGRPQRGITFARHHAAKLAAVQSALGAAEFEEAWSSGRARAAADPVGYGLDYVSR